MNWFKQTRLTSNFIHRSIVFTCLIAFQFSGFAQKSKKIEIIQADSLVYTKRSGIEAQRLIGNVIFRHQKALMYCDSAFLYKNTNELEAFGTVRINQGDTLHLTGDNLKYDGNTQIATVTGKVVELESNNFNLTTDRLIYDRAKNIADYYTGGVIESKNDSNILVSEIGHYFANQQLFTFKDKVKLSNPDFVMNSDTLKYFSATEMVNFLGPTTILGDSNLIYCENGWYDTKLDRSQYFKNAYILSDGKKLFGDTLYYDRLLGYGQADHNISVIDTAQNMIIQGGHGEIYENIDSAIVTKRALLIQLIEEDSLFMHADTFKVFRKKNGVELLTAYHKVKIFKSDLQGKCDSICYVLSDSTIQLFVEPILWSEENQLTADRIDIRMANKKIHSIFLNANAFIISEVDSIRYNQIKGKEMTGYFKNSALHKIKVRGNGETTYFGQDEKEKFIGVNVAESTDLDILIEDSQIHSISFLNQPNAVMHPMGELNPVTELRYKGFQWLNHLRPLNKGAIFLP